MKTWETTVKKHTPGPWAQFRTVNGDRFITAEGDRGLIELATVYAEAEYQAKLPDEANARLIAAAPEMLEALRAAQLELNEYFELLRRDHPMHDAYLTGDKVDAAIAKAEGRK